MNLNDKKFRKNYIIFLNRKDKIRTTKLRLVFLIRKQIYNKNEVLIKIKNCLKYFF